VYRSTDLGQNWEAIGGDLPEIPVNVLIQDPDVQSRLFVGTDAGIYMTNDYGATWHCISENIPNAPVMAMEFHHGARTLYAGTYGVSAYKAYIPKEMLGMDDRLSNEQIELFPNPIKSGDILTIRIQGAQNGEIDYTITDISGKTLFQSNLILKNRNGLFLLNTYKDIGNQLLPGIYFLKFEIDQKSYGKKIIVN
jgi:hypothetical protein